MLGADLVEDINAHGQLVSDDVDAVQSGLASGSHVRIGAIDIDRPADAKARRILRAASGEKRRGNGNKRGNTRDLRDVFRKRNMGSVLLFTLRRSPKIT